MNTVPAAADRQDIPATGCPAYTGAMETGRRRVVVTAAVGGGIVAAHAGAYAFFAGRNPYTETIFPPCIILHLTGLQCPGCGGTRSLYSLLHGDVLGSLQMNPIVVAGYLAVILGLLGMLLDSRRSPIARWCYTAAAAVAIGAVVWSTLIRNLL